MDQRLNVKYKTLKFLGKNKRKIFFMTVDSLNDLGIIS